jgi:Holliday junction DNA helicase RuvA
MIAFIEGTLEDTSIGSVIINCNGIGYEISVPTSLPERLPAIGEQVRLYTQLIVSEQNGVSLAGFLSREELETYKLLKSVKGVGSQNAMGLLSAFMPTDIKYAIIGSDSATLKKAPGIGKATADRIIFELKDKINLEETINEKLSGAGAGSSENSSLIQAKHEAVMALEALGYSRTQALNTVNKLKLADNADVDTILSEALRNIN